VKSQPDKYTAAHLWIPGSELFIEYFGCWPSFHDTELFEIRVVAGANRDSYNGYIDFFLGVNGLDLTVSQGAKREIKYCRGTMRLESVKYLKLHDLWCYPEISFIKIVQRPEADPANFEPKYSVEFYGLECEFQCSNVRVLSVSPCDYTYGSDF
jgi:hypothetical protein